MVGIYEEGFEYDFDCWYLYSKTEDYAAVSEKYSYEGDKSLCFQTGESEYSYAVIPVEASLDTLELSFYLYTDVTVSTSLSATLHVGVIDNLADFSNISDLYELSLKENGVWQEVALSFSNYEGTGTYIILYCGEAETENTIYIDNVQLQRSSSCYAPLMPYVANQTAYTAEIDWIEPGSATSWNVRVSTTELTEAELNASSSSDLQVANPIPYQLTNLLPSTKYYVYIQSVSCNWNYEPVEFETYSVLSVGQCDVFDYESLADLVPYVYYGNLCDDDYDGEWVEYPYHTVFGVYDYTYPEIKFVNNSDNGSTGWSLYFFSYNNKSAQNRVPFVIFPEFDNTIALDSVQISFWVRYSRLTHPLVVSICDGYDISTAVVIDTIYPVEVDVWEKFYVSFEDYTGSGRHITFSTLFGDAASSDINYYLDDLCIDYIQECNPISSVNVTDIQMYEATISWMQAGADPESSYIIDLYDEIKTDTSEPVKTYETSSTNYTMTDLECGTGYYAYIRSSNATCSAASTESTVFYFLTRYEIGVGYYNDFSDEPVGSSAGGPTNWYLYNLTTESATYIPAVYSGSYWKDTSPECSVPYLQIYTTTANKYCYAVMPYMADSVDMSDLMISFYGLGYSSSGSWNLAVGIMDDPYDYETFVAVDTVTTSTYEVAEFFEVSTYQYTGSGRYIAFHGFTDTKSNRFLMDNLFIDVDWDCEVVSDIEVDAPDASTLNVNWTKGKLETSWRVLVFKSEITAEDVDDRLSEAVADTTVTEEKATLTGFTHLNAFTYYVAVQSLGDDGCVSDWEVTTYLTGCDLGYTPLPYTENFNGYGTGDGTSPDCWILKPLTYLYEAELQRSTMYPDYDNGTSSGAALVLEGYCATGKYAGYSYAITPLIDSIKYTILEFYCYSTFNNSYVEVGVLSAIDNSFSTANYYDSPANDQLFTSLFKFENGPYQDWEKVEYDFSSYQGSGNRIAFRVGMHDSSVSSTWMGIAIDNVTISRTEYCTTIFDAEVTAVTTDAITYSWDPLYESTWDVKVSSTAIDPETQDADVVTFASITSSTYTASQLNSDTEYYFYVRRTNSEQNCIGEWSEAVVGRTYCGAIATGYVDDFEANEVGVDVSCWSLFGDTDVLPYVQEHSLSVTGQDATDDDKLCMAIANSTSTISDVATIKNIYAVLPEITGDDINDVELSFRVYSPYSTGGQFEVGVVTDPSSSSTTSDSYAKIYADTVSSGEWTSIRVKFADYTGNQFGEKGSYIAIYANAGWTGSELTSNIIYIDDVAVFKATTDCDIPLRFKADSVGNNGVKFSWIANEVSSYEIMISTDSDFESSASTTTTVTSNPAVVSGLPANTRQYAKVRSACSDATHTDWSSVVEFYTYGCDENSLPYVEDFEKYVGYSDRLSNCLSFYLYNAASEAYTVALNTSTSMSGDYCLELPAGKLMALPITQSIDKLAIQFDMSSTNSAKYYAQIGIVRWVDDEMQFISFEELNVNEENTVELFTVNFSNYADQIQDGDQLAILSLTAGLYSNLSEVYIDNIYVNVVDAAWTPKDVSVSDINYNAVSLLSYIVTTPTFMEVAYMTEGQTISDAAIVTISNDPFDSVRVTGLEPLTTYRMSARVSLNGEYSDWSDEVSFTTSSIPAQLPYNCEFEVADENSNWVVDGSATTYSSWYVGSATKYAGDNSLYIREGETETYGYSADGATNSWVFRDIEILNPGVYNVSLMAKCNTNDASDYISVSFIPTWYDINFSSTYYTNTLTNDVINVASTSFDENDYLLTDRVYQVSEWETITGDVAIEKAGVYRLAVLFASDANADSGEPGAIDNVSVTQVLCSAPVNFVVDDITNSSATLSWLADTGVDSWDVIVADVDVTDVSTLSESNIAAQSLAIATSSYTVENLASLTTYYVYIRQNCTDNSSVEYQQYQFTTIIEPKSLPYYEPFDLSTTIATATVQFEALGWEFLTGSLDVVNSYGPVVLTAAGSTGTLQFPEFDENFDIQDLVLVFEALSYASGATRSIAVGVLEIRGDASTFVGLDTVTASILASPVVFDKFTTVLDGYTGTSRTLAIQFLTGNSRTYFDNIYLYYITPCDEPTNLEVTDIADRTASLSFDIVEGQASWRVVASDRSLTSEELDNIEVGDAAFVADVTSNSNVQISGLTGLTTYAVYVRSNTCDEGGDWSEAAIFSTLISPETLSYYETFSSTSTGSLPLGWLRSASDIDGSSFTTLSKSDANYSDFAVAKVDEISSSPVLYAQMNSDATSGVYHWAISPEIIIDEEAMLSFDIRLEKGEKYALLSDIYMSTRATEIRLLISTDDAATWDQIYVIGDEEGDDYQLYDLLETTIKLSHDMSSYIGDTIRFAFYIDNEDLVYLDVNIDNVSINCVGERTYSDVVNQGWDYTLSGFNLSYADLDGVTSAEYNTFVPGADSGVCDSLITVNLTVMEPIIQNFTAEICAEGSVYDANGFTESYEGIFLNEDIAVSGADSLTYLTLIAREANVIATTTAYICEGEEYTFADMVLTEAGVYYDTLVDVNGCDSILELTLNFITGEDVQYEEATICEGEYYEFNDSQYTEGGVYQGTFTTESGCDYNVELILTVLNVDTTYVTETITLDELPYEYGDVVFDETTTVGVHTYEYAIDNKTDCPDVEILTLTVIEGDVAVETTSILDLTIYPNPLAAGATLYVDAEFTAAERDGMVVEVMNMVGQRIISERPTTDAITINGLTQSGVYIVRITTGTGSQYLGKVIVK